MKLQAGELWVNVRSHKRWKVKLTRVSAATVHFKIIHSGGSAAGQRDKWTISAFRCCFRPLTAQA